MPKISIVTVVFNDKNNIENTIKSCLNQTYSDVEYIIIDGKSNDGTLDLILKYKSKIDSLISKIDGGIYDAMNKGIEIATSEWIIFMNSGDTFFNDNVLSEIFNKKQNCDLIYGKNQSIYPYFKRINSPQVFSKLKYGMIFSHQSMLVKTDLMKKYKFDVNYKMSADYNFIYKLYKKNYVFNEVDVIISKVLAGGTSEINLFDTHIERKKIALSYEKGLNRFKLKIKYTTTSIKIVLINFIKKILPKVLIEKITRLKYR